MEENQIIVDIGLDAFIESLRRLQKQYELNTAALKAMKDAGEEQSDAYITLTQEQKVLRQQMASTEKSIQNEIKMQQSQEGSLVQLRAQLANLNKQYDSMSGMERMGKSGEELQGRIKALHDQILGLEGDTGRMQRNVGNYPEAMKPVTAQLREMTQELVRLRMEGKANTEEYQQLLQKTGEMKDAMMDAQAEVKQMASDTGTLNSVLAGAQASAGAFSVALGVMNLVGDKDSETAKELAEAQQKLQSAIAITTGLQALQNALQKESALMMGINKLRMLAAAAAQRAYAAATRDAEAAQAVFNRVAKSNIYVWLAGVILTVVGAIAAFTRGSKEQEEQIKAVNDELSEQVKVIKALRGEYEAAHNTYVKNKENEIELLKAQGKSVKEIQEAEDDLYSLQAEGITQQKEDYKDIIDNLDTYKLKVKELSNTIRDNAEKESEVYSELEKIQEGYFVNFQKYPMLLGKTHEEQVKILQSMYDAHVQIGKTAMGELTTLQDNINTAEKILQDEADLTNSRLIQLAEREKARKEKRKKDAEEAKKYAEKILKETQKAEDALNALISDEFEQRRKIEETAYQRQVDEIKKAMAAEKKARGENTKLYKAYLSQLESLRLQHLQTMGEIAGEEMQVEKTMHDDALRLAEESNARYWQDRINEAILQGKKTGQIELEQLKDNLDNMHQYADESDAAFNSRRLQAQVEYLNKKKQLAEAEKAIEHAKYEFIGSISTSTSEVMAAVAGDNKALVQTSKVVALAEVAIKQGVAIANAVAASAAGDPYTYAFRIASAIASTVAAMAKAIASINSASFETGGVIGGKFVGATMGRDNAVASVRTGEMVLNADQQKRLYDIANGGTTVNLTASLVEALQAMPAPVLVYSEFRRFTDRVATLDDAAKLH